MRADLLKMTIRIVSRILMFLFPLTNGILTHLPKSQLITLIFLKIMGAKYYPLKVCSDSSMRKRLLLAKRKGSEKIRACRLLRPSLRDQKKFHKNL